MTTLGPERVGYSEKFGIPTYVHCRIIRFVLYNDTSFEVRCEFRPSIRTSYAIINVAIVPPSPLFKD